MLIGGIVSKASGGSFERGVVTAGVVFLYNDYHSCETFWPHGLCNVARNVKEISKYPQRIIQGVGGGLQIVSSVTTMTPAQEAYALALFGHGVNNMQEAWTVKNGYLKEYAYEPIFGKYANSIYSVIDLGLSGYGMIRVIGVREIKNSYNLSQNLILMNLVTMRCQKQLFHLN